MTTLETQRKALELLENIDGKLLRVQRKELMEHGPFLDNDALEGLLALTDALADFLADVLDDDSALLTENDEEE
jgi:hypothetical protein